MCMYHDRTAQHELCTTLQTSLLSQHLAIISTMLWSWLCKGMCPCEKKLTVVNLVQTLQAENSTVEEILQVRVYSWVLKSLWLYLLSWIPACDVALSKCLALIFLAAEKSFARQAWCTTRKCSGFLVMCWSGTAAAEAAAAVAAAAKADSDCGFSSICDGDGVLKDRGLQT